MTATGKGDTRELVLFLQPLISNIKNTERIGNKRILLRKREEECEKTLL